MPTPRQHGGAALATFPLTTPAFKGVNTQAKNSLLGPEWATRLLNATIDGSGRLAARKGWNSATSTANSNAFVKLIEYVKSDGTVQIVATTDATVVASSDAGDSWSDVTGTASFTSGDWHLVNFNGEVIGFQSGKSPLLYDGTSASHIADINSKEPKGGAGTSAYGRLWASSEDGTTLQYSALLDSSDWSSADAGSFDLSNVWPGHDTIVAVAEHNGALIVFGNRNIILFTDGTGSPLGMDPINMYVVDTIQGLGCASQESIQSVGGDLWFLGDDMGMYSLGRVIQEKSSPINNLSKNVSDDLRDYIVDSGFDISDLRSIYSPKDRFYLLSLPKESGGAETGQCWVFDTRGTLDDGSARSMGVWQGLVPLCMVRKADGKLVMSLRSTKGKVGTYEGNKDDAASYVFDYESGWFDLTGQNYLLMLKRIKGLFFINGNTSATIKWGFDFKTTLNTKPLTLEGVGSGAQWGISEFGIGEFSGGVSLSEKKVAGFGTGSFIKVGTTATINGGEYAVQQLDLMAKIGRLN